MKTKSLIYLSRPYLDNQGLKIDYLSPDYLAGSPFLKSPRKVVFKELLYSYNSKLSRLGGGNIDFNENLGVNFELYFETPTKGLFVNCLQFLILPVFSLVVFALSPVVIAATARHSLFLNGILGQEGLC